MNWELENCCNREQTVFIVIIACFTLGILAVSIYSFSPLTSHDLGFILFGFGPEMNPDLKFKIPKYDRRNGDLFVVFSFFLDWGCERDLIADFCNVFAVVEDICYYSVQAYNCVSTRNQSCSGLQVDLWRCKSILVFFSFIKNHFHSFLRTND